MSEQGNSGSNRPPSVRDTQTSPSDPPLTRSARPALDLEWHDEQNAIDSDVSALAAESRNREARLLSFSSADLATGSDSYALRRFGGSNSPYLDTSAGFPRFRSPRSNLVLTLGFVTAGVDSVDGNTARTILMWTMQHLEPIVVTEPNRVLEDPCPICQEPYSRDDPAGMPVRIKDVEGCKDREVDSRLKQFWQL